MTDVTQSRISNRLLTALPAEAYALLEPHLKQANLVTRTVLHEPDKPITSVYFPEKGYVSLLANLEGGDAAEVGLIGTEGLVGVPLVFGTDRSLVEALVQSEGTALRLDAEVLRRVLAESVPVRELLLRYAMALNTQVTMTAACNGHHLVEQRLARWLLMAHDRSEGDDFPMTHEFLSLMLGVRRAGVSVAAGMLQKAGLIRYGAGRMLITDRPGLEAAACECHMASKREFNCLLGPTTRT